MPEWFQNDSIVSAKLRPCGLRECELWWWGIDDESSNDHDTVKNPGSIRGNGIAVLDTDVLVPIIRRGVGVEPLLKKERSLYGDRNARRTRVTSGKEQPQVGLPLTL